MNEEDRLLEQYKLFVDSALKVSQRRTETNKFFISILSALLAFLAFVFTKKICIGYERIVLLSFSILGLLLNSVWFINLMSYRKLNTAKFKIINDMEKQLPYPCFDKEWDELGRGESKDYKTLTSIEQLVPAIIAIPYLLLLIYAIAV